MSTVPAHATTLESPDGRLLLLGCTDDVPAAGDLVDIITEQATLLGYVEQVGDPDRDGVRPVTGRLVAGDGSTLSRTRSVVHLVPAGPGRVGPVLGGPDARLHLGHVDGPDSADVGLLAPRMNRHTFWCGQSGSGKTYALGVALERLLLATRLPMVVLDPNGDFVGLGRPREDADPGEAAVLAGRDVVVLSPDDPKSPLRVRFVEMTLRAKAAVLRLDPVADRAEYNALVRLAPEFHENRLGEIVPRLRSLGDPDALALAQRIENLGVLYWNQTWALGAACATATIARRPAATVLDLGGYGRHEEQLTIALAVLDDLWARRAERRPVLLVLDEAHTFCPPDPETPLGVAVRDRLVQIAAEGRKYGLWLVLSTQRPSKIHPGVLSQCDNLALMRMNSPADLAELAAVFGFVPRQLLDRAARFTLGEALVAGGFVALPTVVRMRGRITPEGGTDIPVPLD
jgi:uncharacterized protein